MPMDQTEYGSTSEKFSNPQQQQQQKTRREEERNPIIPNEYCR